MLFKNLRCSARIGKASGLIDKKRYKEAKDILYGIIEANPPEYMVALVRSSIGEVEFYLKNYEEALPHLEFCIEDSVNNPEQWEADALVEELERIHWFYKECRKHAGHANKQT